ncbi:MAG: NAD(P)H-hydrate dehydratase [Planctomycetes bacterium]|nr:NAD(P)H-hydrate dehydratase [Planctomycetota bacterium]
MGEVERSLAVPELAPDAHKGDAGRVLVVCGSELMPGAALLVARAAQRAGAGLVTVLDTCEAVARALPIAAPEAILLRVPHPRDLPFAIAERGFHSIVAGCGLGLQNDAQLWLRVLNGRESRVPLVADADALNALEGAPDALSQRVGPTVITPHPGEAARLLRRAIPGDPQGRERAARELAELSGAIVCLKGQHTVVTDGRQVYVNDTGNPGMATAGAGDVLAGIVGAYLALCGTGQHPHWTPLDAACAAVRAHGLAGDLAAAHLGRRAVIASDLIQWLAQAQRRLSS